MKVLNLAENFRRKSSQQSLSNPVEEFWGKATPQLNMISITSDRQVNGFLDSVELNHRMEWTGNKLDRFDRFSSPYMS